MGDESSKAFDESDGFSDIDDAEVRTKDSNILCFLYAYHCLHASHLLQISSNIMEGI